MDRRYLASEQVNTPDPMRSCFLGQKVIVYWELPRKCRQLGPLTLIFTVRYGNKEVEELEIPLKNTKGIWTYEIINEKYCALKAMSSYKAEIYAGDVLVAHWKHHIWVDIIEVTETEEEDCQTEEATESNCAKASFINNSVESQSRQGSVTETPYLS